MGRPEERRHLEPSVRQEWIERDMDEVLEKLESIEARVGRVLWTLGGILVSVCTACILLVVNLAAGR